MPQAFAGETIEPSVSVPIALRQARRDCRRQPRTRTGRAALEVVGTLVWPPRPLHPLAEWNERKFAHSLMFVLPRMTAPDIRSRNTCVASSATRDFTSASDPAVVSILSLVSMLSL